LKAENPFPVLAPVFVILPAGCARSDVADLEVLLEQAACWMSLLDSTSDLGLSPMMLFTLFLDVSSSTPEAHQLRTYEPIASGDPP